jgi:hypothetical protein
MFNITLNDLILGSNPEIRKSKRTIITVMYTDKLFHEARFIQRGSARCTSQHINRGSLRTQYSFSQNILLLLYDTQIYNTTFTAPWILF